MSNIEDIYIKVQEAHYDPMGGPNSQRAIDLAKVEGLEVKFPETNQLFIDIDDREDYETFWAIFPIIMQHLGAIILSISVSRSGGEGKHIVVQINRGIDEITRVALQACLGSDRVRETLGVIQALNNDPHPTLFLEKTDAAGPIVPIEG